MSNELIDIKKKYINDMISMNRLYNLVPKFDSNTRQRVYFSWENELRVKVNTILNEEFNRVVLEERLYSLKAKNQELNRQIELLGGDD